MFIAKNVAGIELGSIAVDGVGSTLFTEGDAGIFVEGETDVGVTGWLACVGLFSVCLTLGAHAASINIKTTKIYFRISLLLIKKNAT